MRKIIAVLPKGHKVMPIYVTINEECITFLEDIVARPVTRCNRSKLGNKMYTASNV